MQDELMDGQTDGYTLSDGISLLMVFSHQWAKHIVFFHSIFKLRNDITFNLVINIQIIIK